MKIGLLTVYSFNYGSFFQAVSLQRKLQDMGHDCELINERFKMSRWMNLKLLYTFYHIIPNGFNQLISRFLPQYNTFLKLQKDVSCYPQSPNHIRDMEKISERYDCIVLGSDELWSANNQSIRYTEEYFGHKLTRPHIAYAPSATLFDLENQELCQKAKEGLKTYQDIAVRDIYTQEVVSKLIGQKVPIVLDPTLLNPFFINKKVHNHGGYVLLYGQDYLPEQKNTVLTIAAKNNWQVMALGWPQEWADGFLNPDTAEAFQEVFENAEFCFPSTFHGTIFSILHQKQFISMITPLRGRKVNMLLEQLGLQNRIFSEKNDFREHIDYNQLNHTLVHLRKESEQYLSEALLRIEKQFHCTKNPQKKED